MEKESIALNHIEVVSRFLRDKFYAEHFQIYNLSDSEDVYERISKMSDKQYNYLLVLLNKKKLFKIKKLLDQFLKHL